MQLESLLVDLDAILDTRLPLLLEKFPDDQDYIIVNYFGRATNAIENLFTFKEFNEWYLNRDKHLLINARMTSVLFIVKDFVNNVLSAMHSNISHAIPHIFLNIYPYDLNNNELKFIIKGILAHIRPEVNIDVISIDNTKLKPSYLNNTIWGMIKFDFYNWIIDNGEILKDDYEKCPDVKVITPAYFPAEINELPSLFIKDGKKIDPYNNFSILMKPIIDIEFVRTTIFDMLIKDDQDQDPQDQP